MTYSSEQSDVVSNLTVRSADAGGNFTVTEAVDPLTADTNGYAADSFTYDNNGNLTYDGLQQYTYDAWNRLSTVAHAYRDFAGDGNVHAGQVSATYRYDALGRRILKTVTGTGAGTGALDCTYHYYYDGQRNIEVQNGSAMVLKQQVWNAGYVDSLAQEGVNSSPTTQTTCDTFYGVCQDANYNVLGLVNASGALAERYEYSPYGQRTVLASAGANDPGLYAASLVSQRVVSGGVNQPYGLCEFGHQGLFHDDESGLVYNRARTLHPGLGRFLQQDPLGYVDSASLYLGCHDSPVAVLDASGRKSLEGYGSITPDNIYISPLSTFDRSESPAGGWSWQHPWSRKPGNLTADFEWKIEYECDSEGKITVHSATLPEWNVRSGSGNANSTGLSIGVVGMTETHSGEISTKVQVGECAAPLTGQYADVGISIGFHTRESGGINPGIGPISIDIGASIGDEFTFWGDTFYPNPYDSSGDSGSALSGDYYFARKLSCCCAKKTSK
jgi:RHS repeat-associated protein